MECSACRQVIKEVDSRIICSNTLCKQAFHAVCTKTEQLRPEEADAWICPDCNAKRRKGGDNTHTPVRSFSDNITHRNKNRPPPPVSSPVVSTGVPSEVINSFSAEICLLRQNMTEMWEYIRKSFDNLSSKLSNYDTRIKSLEAKSLAQENENATIKTKLDSLQNQLKQQLQHNMKKELEICALEETPNESPCHLALTAALKIGVELKVTDIDYVSRAGPIRHTKEKGSISGSAPSSQPRPLVIAFTRQAKREEFLKHAKARRFLKNKDIVENGSDATVFINERLTANDRRLFRVSRQFAKNHAYKHCWIRNGNIFLRQKDYKEGSPAIRIQSDEDLQRLLESTALSQPGGSLSNRPRPQESDKPSTNV